MSTTTPPTPAVNGEPAPIPIQGVVVLSEADYRQLLEERQQLREQVRYLEQKYALMRDGYKNIHHAYYLLVKDKLPPFEEDPNWRPPSPEEAVTAEELLAMIDEIAREEK